MMELIFLGTASAIPTNYRNHSAIALKAFGEVFLWDCGEGTQRQMYRAKISPMKINQIFITHLHGDHFLGLPGMIQSMAFRGRTDPLDIYGPPGLDQMVRYIKDLGYFSLSFPIHTHEVEQGIVMEKESYRISCCLAEHNVPNLAYALEEKRNPKFLKENALKLGLKPGPDFGKLQRGMEVRIGKRIIRPEQVLGPPRKGRKIIYSGDTRPCEQLVNLAQDANILIHESTFDNSHKSKAEETKHSTASEAAFIAHKARVKQLILTHLSTRYQETDVIKKEAREIFENTLIASDFMNVKVER